MARIAARVLTLGTVEEIEQFLHDAFAAPAGATTVGRIMSTFTVKRVEKPWGYELHWAKTDRYVGKVLHINAGHALSLQYHNIKDETIYVYQAGCCYEIEVGRRADQARDAARRLGARHAEDRAPHDGDRRLRRVRSVDAGTGRCGAARGSVRAAGNVGD